MNDTSTARPPRCHYDHTLGQRVTSEHRDDCPDPDTHKGCVPCTAPHCRICGREHASNDQPMTCATCIGKVRADLTDIQQLCRQLRPQAAYAGGDGRLAAAAPIPGALAQILIGPSVDPDTVLVSRHWADDHRAADPIPPLAVLAWWEDTWRTWHSHTPAARASIAGAIGYLDQQLTDLAQTDPAEGGPDFADFASAMIHLRISLEHALHDEREPERGVECFECGARLVRRHRDRRVCRHQTPARRVFTQALDLVTLGYPEIGPTPAETRAARVPCGKPSCDQGGLADPSAGQSWECPSCRKDYDPGEYATAVRRSLLDDADAGDGWTDIRLAAEAASTLTGRLVPATTVRKWMDRGRVGSLCLWRPGQRWGQRLVYWPDVADIAAASLRRLVSGRAS